MQFVARHTGAHQQTGRRPRSEQEQNEPELQAVEGLSENHLGHFLWQAAK